MILSHLVSIVFPGDLVGQLIQGTAENWELRAVFGRFQLNTNWQNISQLVLGSVNVNNVLARERRRVTKQHLLGLLRMAGDLSCDALGGGFNQGVHQLDAIQKEFIVWPTTCYHLEQKAAKAKALPFPGYKTEAA